MSYLTAYNISIHETIREPAPSLSDICDTLNLIAGEQLFDDDGDSVEELRFFTMGVPHMLTLSQDFPGITILLEGSGEEQGDMWREYYRDGRMQHIKAEITFADFDPEKLR